MRLLPFILLMFVCIAAGVREPFFFLGAYFLFVWIAVALFARAVRWLIRASGVAPVGAKGSCCPGGRFEAESNRSPIHKRMGHPDEKTGNPEARMGAVRVCPDDRCGRVNTGAARYCGQCGRRLA